MTTMKLSDAIRLGAMLKPQIRFESHTALGTCAIGAAMHAIGQAGKPYISLGEYFPIASTEARQPESGDTMLVVSAIRELNDHHDWTREQIADWVSTIEAQQETAGGQEERGMVSRSGELLSACASKVSA